MNKKYLKVALMGAMIMAVAGSSCSKDDDNNDPTFVPPADATKANIIDWLTDANDALKSANQLTIGRTSEGTQGGVAYSSRDEDHYDNTGKKRLSVEYITVSSKGVNNVVIESSYRESNTAGGYTQYEYEYSGDYEEDLLGSGLKANLFTKTKRVITDGNSTYKYDGSFIYTDGNDTYEVKSGVIVVTHTSSGASYSSSEKREVTLNENKSYKSVKSTRTETEDGQTSTWVSNYTFAYTANARLVVGNKDEYVEVQPIVVTIVWGEGKANGTLNSAPDSYVQLSDGGVSGYGIDYNYISVNAPSVPGKVIVGWKVNGVDVGSYHNFTPTANITITAVWEDED